MRPAVRYPPRWSRAAVLPLVVFAYACEKVSVAAVDVTSVRVDPSVSVLLVHETGSLEATAHASSGSVLRGRPVSWESLDPDVVSVDADGVVRALSTGTATIQATIDGVVGTASITVATAPAIELSETTVSFTAPFGGAPTPAQSLTVRASDGSTISGLSATITAKSPGDWIEVELTSPETPSTLAVRTLPAGMGAGTYAATISLAATTPGVAPATLQVTLRVGEPLPLIVVDPASLSLAADQGQAPPPPRAIDITNGGGGSLSGLRFTVEYVAGAGTGWLTTSLNRTVAPAVLSIGVAPGSLAPGVYDARVVMEAASAPGASAAVQVRFRYGEPPPEIELGASDLMWDVVEGTLSIATQSVAVMNRGSEVLGSLSARVRYQSNGPTGWLTAGVNPTAAPATLHVSVLNTGLTPGEYRAFVDVESPSAINSPQTVAVLLRVRGRASPTRSTVTAAPTSIPADGASTSVITVRLLDANGNPVTSGGQAVTMSTTAGSLGSVQSAGGGVYTAVLTAPKTAGTANVSASVGGVLLTRTATVTFTAGPPSATTTTLTAAPTSIPADGAIKSTITLQLLDASGNPTTPEQNAAVSFVTTAGTLGPVTNPGTGQYVVTLSATAVGVANVTARLGGTAFKGPVSVTLVAPPPSPATSTLTAAPTSIVANGTSTSTITLQLRNASGANTAPPADMAVAFNTTAGTLGAVTNPSTGRYVVTLRSTTTVGVANVTATLGGSAFVGPTPVSFVGGPPAAATSSLAAAPTSLVANGTSTSTITLQLRDANGNTTSAGNVNFVTTAGTLGSVTNPATGIYVVTLRSATTVGVANVTARLGGSNFKGPVPVTFVAGPAAGIRLTGPKNGIPLIPTAPLTLTIVDAFGNPTTSSSAESFTLANSGQPGVFIPGSPITIPAGLQSAIFTFTSIQGKGSRTITATWLSGGPTPLGSATHEIKY